MALVVADRVQETSVTSGTGTLTLAGALAGYQTFSTAIGNGNTTFYTIYDANLYDWEVGIGTVGAGTLARTTVLSNSAGTTSPISFASNSKFVFCTYPAEKSINYDANGVATIGDVLNYADTGIVGSFASTVAGYNQVIVQNKSTATNASSNLNVSNDAGTAGANYAELGINSSTFTGAGSFNIAGASYVASASTDLTIGTYGAYSIHFVTNSNTTDAMTIYNNGGVSLGTFANPGINNIAASKFVPGYTGVTSAAGTTVLTADSNYYQNLLGSTTQTFQLPDATTLLVGTTFIFDNNSSGNLTVVDNASGPIETIPGGAAGFVYLYNNSTVAGSWNRHSFLPASYDFNTTTANFGTATITNATWNGNTIGTAYGGTGLTTFSAANYALYSTNASTLTAGTLPVAAGGTNITGYAVGDLLFANTATSLDRIPVGTNGYVLTSNGTAPAWAALPSTVASFQTSLDGLTPSTATTGAVTLAGTLGVTSGGTGLTSLTAGYIPYGNGTSPYASSSALQYSVQYSAGANPILYSTNGVATGTGTLSFPTTNTGIGFYSRGSTSIGGFAVQDGQGRLNQYWNAYTDSGGVKYIVSGEAAARYQMHINSTTGAYHAWYGAPSGTAGTALTWTMMANWVSGTGGYAWISPRGTSSDFYIDINGNVGMGTTSPVGKLNVIGGLGVGAALTGDNAITPLASGGIAISGGNQASLQTYTSIGSGTTVGALNYYAATDQSFNRFFDIAAYGSTTGATGNIRFLTGSSTSTERMRIDGSGNVGIGTTSPSAKLQINGTGTSIVRILETSTTGYGGFNFSNTGTQNYSIGIGGTAETAFSVANKWYLYDSLAGAMRMVVDTSGNVGIGTTSPTLFSGYKTLSLEGTNGGVFESKVAGGATAQFYASSAGTVINSTSALPLILYTSSVERMRITSNGGVSFGSSGTAYGTSGQILQSNGDAAPTWITPAAGGVTSITGTANQVIASASTGAVTLSTPQSIGTASSVQFGSFGVGTAASGTTGEIRATNNVTAFYSDARLKDFKGTIPNALAKVQLLNGYYFTENARAKELGYNNDKMQVGVSAQEVEAVMPEVVTDAPINANFEGADYKTVYYDKLVPLLIEAIKELSEKVAKLEGK
jgi:hypothetical protein